MAVTSSLSSRRPRLATVWLGGCSGCHMSFLDLDERLIDLVAQADLVFSPVIDIKVFPPDVDVTLVEGAVANEDHRHMLQMVRERSRIVAAFGDCAVTGNVTAMRNPLRSAQPVLERSYLDAGNLHPQIPCELPIVPPLVDNVVPIHHLVTIDFFIPGCPPSADLIHSCLMELLAGRIPATAQHRFG